MLSGVVFGALAEQAPGIAVLFVFSFAVFDVREESDGPVVVANDLGWDYIPLVVRDYIDCNEVVVAPVEPVVNLSSRKMTDVAAVAQG